MVSVSMIALPCGAAFCLWEVRLNLQKVCITCQPSSNGALQLQEGAQCFSILQHTLHGWNSCSPLDKDGAA